MERIPTPMKFTPFVFLLGTFQRGSMHSWETTHFISTQLNGFLDTKVISAISTQVKEQDMAGTSEVPSSPF